ncbi:hypothetical protein MVEN_00725600 [Mycena venus]|uniref:Uncharacterized protein n=1 Tax=Mycena venus TaxID=2733690 RepID=A0A8H6YJS4_9AGAR|nr:hypothetical protein MVEN_00725600 [Mycena venus]
MSYMDLILPIAGAAATLGSTAPLSTDSRSKAAQRAEGAGAGLWDLVRIAYSVRIAFCTNRQPCVLDAEPTSSSPSTSSPSLSPCFHQTHLFLAIVAPRRHLGRQLPLLRNPSLLALGHPGLTHPMPHALPPTGSPSSCSSLTASTTYTSTPAVL